MSEAENAIRVTYLEDKQYLAYPETKECRNDSDAFMRRRDGVGSWEMAERSVLLLIKTFFMEDQKRE